MCVNLGITGECLAATVVRNSCVIAVVLDKPPFRFYPKGSRIFSGSPNAESLNAGFVAFSNTTTARARFDDITGSRKFFSRSQLN